MMDQANDNFLRVDMSSRVGDSTDKKEGGSVVKRCDDCGSPLGMDESLVLLRPQVALKPFQSHICLYTIVLKFQMKEPWKLNQMSVNETVWCGVCVLNHDKELSAVREPVPPFQPGEPFRPTLPAFSFRRDCNRQWMKPFFEKAPAL